MKHLHDLADFLLMCGEVGRCKESREDRHRVGEEIRLVQKMRGNAGERNPAIYLETDSVEQWSVQFECQDLEGD